MNEYVGLYQQALDHEHGQANKWFTQINMLRTQLNMAEAQYKHHKEESERLQMMIAKWKEHGNEIKSEG